MALHVIKKGLDLPISGEPELTLEAGAPTTRVALVTADYLGMKPTFHVDVGDEVKRGQLLFEDKKTPGILYTAPGAGTVAAVNRGERRALQSVVIELNDRERQGAPGDEDFAQFEHYSGKDVAVLSEEETRALMIEAGMWPALRQRPFSKVPPIDARPDALFITAIDTNPLAPPVDMIVEGREADLNAGLAALAKLTDGPVYFCKAPNSRVRPPVNSPIRIEEFEGPHPAGLPGLHIHTLRPVNLHKTAWHIGYQDVLALGALFRTGQLNVDRVISLGGPSVTRPRLLRTRLGASVDELTAGELKDGPHRVISGSVLGGRKAMGEVHGYLGRHHNQVSVVREDDEREFLGWLTPGLDRYSLTRVFLSHWIPDKKFDFTTSTRGSYRAIVPINVYEDVMPMDILAIPMLRSLAARDIERAEQLGCLELDEEDLALCTFVCPGKYEYGPILRENLTIIEKEG